MRSDFEARSWRLLNVERWKYILFWVYHCIQWIPATNKLLHTYKMTMIVLQTHKQHHAVCLVQSIFTENNFDSTLFLIRVESYILHSVYYFLKKCKKNCRFITMCKDHIKVTDMNTYIRQKRQRKTQTQTYKQTQTIQNIYTR